MRAIAYVTPARLAEALSSPEAARKVAGELLNEARDAARLVADKPTRAKLLRQLARFRRQCGIPAPPRGQA